MSTPAPTPLAACPSNGGPIVDWARNCPALRPVYATWSTFPDSKLRKQVSMGYRENSRQDEGEDEDLARTSKDTTRTTT